MPELSPTLPPRRVLVTGGATNIGRAITESFLRDGARVAVGQLALGQADALRQTHGERVVALQYDQGRAEDCRRLVEDATQQLGGLDVLVNNAAMTGLGAGRLFLDLDDRFIDQVIDVNVKGLIHLSLAAAKVMRRQGTGGVIVNLASITAFRALRGSSVYSATKAAVTNLTQSMAKELAEFGIRVVAVAPGDIWTDNQDQIRAERSALGIKPAPSGYSVLGQGQPSDVGELVAFIASPRARYMTGNTVVVDGGWLA